MISRVGARLHVHPFHSDVFAISSCTEGHLLDFFLGGVKGILRKRSMMTHRGAHVWSCCGRRATTQSLTHSVSSGRSGPGGPCGRGCIPPHCSRSCSCSPVFGCHRRGIRKGSAAFVERDNQKFSTRLGDNRVKSEHFSLHYGQHQQRPDVESDFFHSSRTSYCCDVQNVGWAILILCLTSCRRLTVPCARQWHSMSSM